MILLNRQQMNHLLNSPHYSLPWTESYVLYRLYRGKKQTGVMTLRVKWDQHPSFIKMLNLLEERLLNIFPKHAQLVASIDYDLLLRDSNRSPESFYIWRANSNRRQFDYHHHEEIVFNLNFHHLREFVQTMLNIDMNQLNINFINSSVVVDRVLFVVCSFMQI